MFPPQTSLIPVTVALSRFAEVFVNKEGWLATLSLGGVWYPDWYLGVPFKYLSGPIIPLTLTLTHSLFKDVSLFSISIYLILFSFLLAAIGWGMLAKRISGNRVIGVLVGLVLLVFPWRYLSALALSEASAVISKNLLPFALLASWQYLSKKDRTSMVLAVLAGALLMLINTSIFSILIVSSAAVILAKSFNKGRFRGIVPNIKKILLITIYSLLITTLWYTPGYWITVLANPSIGGASGFKVILRIFDLLRAAVPLALAIVAVYFSGKIRSRLGVFGLTWTFTFLFLTIFRFIGDPDFWQDWTAWFYEIEVGFAVLAGKLAIDISKAKNFQFSRLQRIERSDFGQAIFNFRKYKRQILLILVLLIIPFVVTNYVYGVLNKPKLIANTIPEGVQSLEKLAEIVGNERVFLSGSTVFWANALYDLNQVRGGVDKAAIHPYWDHAAFQLREGSDPELAQGWLEALGVSYVLVHGPASPEAYHDFRNIDKWSNVGEVVWENQGDVIYEVSNVSLAWVVDLKRIKSVKSPKNGTDLTSLNSYLAAKKRPVEAVWKGPGKILLDVKGLRQDEGVVLAVSFNSKWRVDANISLKKDPLGNILVIPEETKNTIIILQYK